MKKIVIIEKCDDCPHFDNEEDSYFEDLYKEKENYIYV